MIEFEKAKTVVSLWIQEHPDASMWIGVVLIGIALFF